MLKYAPHSGLQLWTSDLNRVYRQEKALFELDYDTSGFQWIDISDIENSIVSFIRRSQSVDDTILVVCNFTPVARFNYRVGVPYSGEWVEILNSDASEYGGRGYGNYGRVISEAKSFHRQSCSLNLILPPLGILFFKHL